MRLLARNAPSSNSGAPGGLFTPPPVLGVLFGALLGHAWRDVWPGSRIGGCALIGAAVLAAAFQRLLARPR